MSKKVFKSNREITRVDVTSDTLTGRGGQSLFVRYLSKVCLYELLSDLFCRQRRSKKGLALWIMFKQIFCWLYDGTSRHLTEFDRLKSDAGYAGVIETKVSDMASSHQVKRFFKSFSWLSGKLFRQVLRRMFIWRLKIQIPEVIDLTIDTMVMNNDAAKKRHGSQPTYKKVKGFQPIQIIWNGKIVDGIFRGGKKHSNYGKTVINMTREIVNLIRKEYSMTVPIIIRLDSGFFDEKNFIEFDKLGVGFICTGKMYEGVKQYVGDCYDANWQIYDNSHQEWEYIEFGYRCSSWKNFYRAIYTKPSYEGEQRLLDFARPDNVILTNIGVNPRVLENCSIERQNQLLKAEKIIESHHQRGGDELPHRGLKDFGFEELPFKRFAANSALYYCMLISFFLFETFKEDVLKDVLSIGSYATTVRRTVLDFAAKIVETGREIILKVTNTIMNTLRFDLLWQRCQNPAPIVT